VSAIYGHRVRVEVWDGGRLIKSEERIIRLTVEDELPADTTARFKFPLGVNGETFEPEYRLPLTEPGVLVRIPFETAEVLDFEKDEEGRTRRAKRRRSVAMLEPEVA
jgi:hypothetical protein